MSPTLSPSKDSVPAIIRNTVDLPLPFAPIRAILSPAFDLGNGIFHYFYLAETFAYMF
jgi:hypothetical protein